MNNAIKLSTALGSAMFAMAFAVTVASADTTGVVNTGNHVDVDSGSTTNTTVRVNNNNDANIRQSATSNVNTGNNDTSRNIGGGSIDTGNATVANEFQAQANANHTSVNIAGSNNSGSTASIVNTGDHLNFEGGNNVRTNVQVDNTNRADINQSAYSRLNTGNNDASRNIGGGNIDTGSATVHNSFDARANENDTRISLSGVGGGSNSVDLLNTGDHVNLESGNNVRTNVRVNNENYADINQHSYSNVNTGNNDATRNIFGGDIETGNASVRNDFYAAANSNNTRVNLHNLGGWSVGNESEITNTGDHLDVNGGTHVRTTVDVRGNNEADVDQHVSSHLYTGDNYTSRNAFGGSLYTGNSATLDGFRSMLNWNETWVG